MSGFLNGGSATGQAGGDLSGSFPSPTVVAIQGISIPTPTGTNTVLTYNAGTFAWDATASGGITTLTGDATAGPGSGSVASTVVKIHGASVPIAGSLTTGNVLQVSGASALTYAALNLAGGAGYVTGQLPIGNVANGTAAQFLVTNSGATAPAWVSISGDISSTAAGVITVSAIHGTTVPATPSANQVLVATSGSAASWEALPLAALTAGTSGQVLMSNGTPAATWTTFSGDVTVSATGATTVNSISGSTPILITPATLEWTSGVTSPTLSQVTPGSVATPQNIIIAPQLPNGGSGTAVQNTPGSLVVNVGVPGATGTAGKEAGIVLERNAVQYFYVGAGPLGLSYLGLWGTPTGAAPTSSNYTFITDGTNTYFNAPSGGLEFVVGGNIQTTLSTSGWSFNQAITPTYSQATKTTDAATINTTISAQSAFATASTNITGANLLLKAGAGATSNATFTSGNVIAYVNAPNSSGTEAFFQVQRAGTTLVQLGTQVSGTTRGAIYLGNLTPTSSNYFAIGDTSTNIVNTPGTLQFAVGGAPLLSLTSNTTGSLAWGKTLTTPTISQTAQSTDTATFPLTIQAQNADPSASTNVTGGNLVLLAGAGASSNTTFTSGNVIAEVNAPNSGGTEAFFQVQRAGTAMWNMGALVGNVSSAALYNGGVTPSATNYALYTNTVATTISGTSDVVLAIGGGTYISLSSSSLQWYQARVPLINQATQTTDTATNNFTIQAQNAFATASTNITGGNLVLQAGAGATSNATFASGNVIAYINAPNSGGTEAYFQVSRAGTVLAQIGAEVGSTTNGAIYLSNETPSNSNYTLISSGSTTILNATSTVDISTGGSTRISATSSGVSITEPITLTNQTTAATATAGSATLPTNPVGFLEMTINGTTYKLPYYSI